MKRSHAAWLLAVAVVLGTILRAQDLLQPYENGHRGACAAFFAMMAKNHLRYGLLTTGGVPVLNPVNSVPAAFNYYMHHPPGAILLATLPANVGGTNAPALRLLFLPFSIGIVVLIYRIAARRGKRTGAAAAAIAALLPLGVYYGAFVNFEIPTLFFALLALHLYLRQLRRGRPKDRWRAGVAFAAAVFCDWIALGLPILLLALAPFRRRDVREDGIAPSGARLAAMLLLVGAGVFLLVKLQYGLQLQRFGRDADDGAGLGYYLDATPLAKSFDGATYAAQLRAGAEALIGWPMLAAAGLGLLIALRRLAKRELDSLAFAALVLLGLGLANVVILGNAVARGHDYYLLYLLPAIALLVAELLHAVAGGEVRRQPAAPRVTLAASILIALLVLASFQSVKVLDARRGFKLDETGRQIRDITNETTVVFLPRYFTLQLTVAADRYVETGIADVARFELARRRACDFGMDGRPLVFLVSKEELAELEPALRERLERHGPPSQKGPWLAYELGPLTRT